jgi:hypothetical protein
MASITAAFASMSSAFSTTFQAIEDADVQGELTDAFEQTESCQSFTDSTG